MKVNRAVNENGSVITMHAKDFRHSPNSTEVDAIDFLLSLNVADMKKLKKSIRAMQSLTYQSKVEILLMVVNKMKGF